MLLVFCIIFINDYIIAVYTSDKVDVPVQYIAKIIFML